MAVGEQCTCVMCALLVKTVCTLSQELCTLLGEDSPVLGAASTDFLSSEGSETRARKDSDDRSASDE